MDEPFFSRHVQSLIDGTFDNSPDIITHLQREIRRQLKSIGQWNLPPKYLGFDGESWEGSDALDDLTQEVYIHCIQKRLLKLGQHLAATGSCEGSVRKKLTWFLQDRQEKGNPVARRVFRNIRSASESLIESGKAVSPGLQRLTGNSTILALGQLAAATADGLAEYFNEELGDREFVKLICRECLTSWRMLALTIEKHFNRGLTGYRLDELANLFTELCRRPGCVADSDRDADENESNIWNSISETRTEVRPGRYERTNVVDDRDQYDALLRTLTQRAEATIGNPRIKARVVRMLEKIAELILQGEDVRQLSLRKLADAIGVSKSTLAEDMARLKLPPQAQDAPTSEME